MIDTYSVIIQNQKTMELFNKNNSIFSSYINEGRIGVCKWIESGLTIDQALPELRNLTDDKEEWNAIIVRYIDDTVMDTFESSKNNPYDFLINKQGDPLSEESPVPLIRLTHMLGGIPSLDIEFKPEIIKEENKAPRTIYKPIYDQEKIDKYNELAAKYKYSGKAPSSIIIVSIRENVDKNLTIDYAWQSYKESNSSNFWKRNHYPSKCKFLVYDYVDEGPIQREADDLKFWLSVLLLSINNFDTSILQAYRLYRLDTEIDREEMEASFQRKINRLNNTRYALEKSIKNSIENLIIDEEKLPDYRINISMKLKFSKISNYLVKKKSFPFLSDSILKDIGSWNSQSKKGENYLSENIRKAERVLEQTADKMRIHCTFDESEITALSKFQEEDMLRETHEIYEEIFDIQDEMPDSDFLKSAEIIKTKKNVKDFLKGRLCKRPALLALILVFVIMSCSFMTAFLFHPTDLGMMSWTYVTLLAVILIFATVIILFQKNALNRLINHYNQLINDAYRKLIHNAGVYSTYYSAIASHSRGMSYVNQSASIKYIYENENSMKIKNIKSINVYLAKIKKMCKSFHLNVDFEMLDLESKIDISSIQDENKLLDFRGEEIYPLEINNSGIMVETPYTFTKKIEIIREELYEDDTD